MNNVTRIRQRLNLTQQELADKLEMAYISYFKNLGISYNITDGGEINNGFSGHRHSEETKNKIEKLHKNASHKFNIPKYER